MAMLAVDRLDGQVIAGFHLQERVGRGGMAWVYKAASLQKPEQTVAVKFLNEDSFKNPTLRSRFRLEYKIHRELDHPNIVKAYTLVEETGLLGYAMEWIDGETFRKRFLDTTRSHFITREELRAYFLPILDAMESAHQKGFLHRDLKPSNLMIVQQAGEESPKVLDFGIGKDEEAGRVHTATGEIIGTYHYMAPEQIERTSSPHPVGRHTDVYQLGAVLFHLITRQFPFKGNTANVLLGHTQGEVPDLFRFRPDLQSSTTGHLLKRVVECALEKDPAHRFVSCASFREYMVAALRGDPTGADFEKLQRPVSRAYSTPSYGDEDNFDAPHIANSASQGLRPAPPEFKALAALLPPEKNPLYSVPLPQSGYSAAPSLASLPPQSPPSEEEHEFTRHVASLPQDVKDVLAQRASSRNDLASLPISSGGSSASSQVISARLQSALRNDFSPQPVDGRAADASDVQSLSETTDGSITKPNGFEFQKTQQHPIDAPIALSADKIAVLSDTAEDPIDPASWDASTADLEIDVEKTSLDRAAPSMAELAPYLAKYAAAQNTALSPESSVEKTTQDMPFSSEDLANLLARHQASAITEPQKAMPPPAPSPQGISTRVVLLIALGCLFGGGLLTLLLFHFLGR